ncbi:hypothetical protein SAMN05444008_107201 [Cnuella takakiae]|uniref:EpsG family protein n=1 Tax=Cnuella takakiae TaxID=1302690 RepID=A0A1M5B937_9BACT|nr:EpsG family protein [Cnuella takakiae]OLY93384.1 hypothetical protein BUE76_16970 [Cnuella takakiae]SHF38945.1 hypothetical protein SAMN05444008_107201 [Cnuella takakiae]
MPARVMLSVLVFLATLIRVFPPFQNLGRDFFSTWESFPSEVADGYGLYSLMGKTIGFAFGSFHVFWFFVALLLALSFNSFAKAYSKLDPSPAALLLLGVFTIGFVVPWFCFQNFRFGTAVLLIVPAFFDPPKKFSMKAVFSMASHSLSFIVIGFQLMYRTIRNWKPVVLILLITFAVFYVLKDLLILQVLALSGYENYTNDLMVYADEKESTAFPLLRTAVFAYLGLTILKGQSRLYFLLLLTVYLVAIVLTPFHGRILPIVYLVMLLFWSASVPKGKWGYICLCSLVLLEGVFSFYKVFYAS